MATYATLVDVENAGVVIDNAVKAQALLDDCELEIDGLLAPPPTGPDPVTGLRADIAAMTTVKAGALTRAVVAQFEYHISMGEDFFIRPQPDEVRNPGGGGYKGRLPIISPKAYRILEAAKLLLTSTSVGGSPSYDMLAYQRNLEPAVPGLLVGGPWPLW